MSISIDTGFRKQRCGDMHHIEKRSALMDTLGGIIDLQIVGTDPNVGVIIGNDMAGEYAPPVNPDGSINTNADTTFFICIETAGAVYHVRLADGSEFTITAVQSAAYAGQWYPAKLLAVLIGTTGDFSVGY